MMDINYEYVGGGYYREKGIEKGKPAKLLHGAEIIKFINAISEACPCLHIEPCSPNCTCVEPYSSHGCARCCSYGSKEQQIAAAKYLTQNEK